MNTPHLDKVLRLTKASAAGQPRGKQGRWVDTGATKGTGKQYGVKSGDRPKVVGATQQSTRSAKIVEGLKVGGAIEPNKIKAAHLKHLDNDSLVSAYAKVQHRDFRNTWSQGSFNGQKANLYSRQKKLLGGEIDSRGLSRPGGPQPHGGMS